MNKHPSEIKEKADNVFDSMFEGMRYIFRNKTILGAVTLDLFAVLFGGIVALIPIFASDILKVGSQGFGMLNAATDIGSMCVILTLSIFGSTLYAGTMNGVYKSDNEGASWTHIIMDSMLM